MGKGLSNQKVEVTSLITLSVSIIAMCIPLCQLTTIRLPKGTPLHLGSIVKFHIKQHSVFLIN